MVVLLCSCASSSTVYNFKVRKDDYFISEDNNVLVDYKTDANGELIRLNIDRLLTIEEMLVYNPLVDYDYVLDGFTGDIFTSPGFSCTNYNQMMVPINLEVGSTRFKYNRNDCEYQEVDRNDDYRSGSYSRKYGLEETIGVSKEVIVTIVIYDESSLEKFVEIMDLPHTVKLLGVYSVLLNDDLDGFDSRTTNYYHDMAIYEQLMLKYQENETTINEVLGYSMDINLLDFDQLAEVVPLIEDFEEDYSMEITAINELEDLIGVISDGEDTSDEE